MVRDPEEASSEEASSEASTQRGPQVNTHDSLAPRIMRFEVEHDDTLGIELMAARLFAKDVGPLKVGRFTVLNHLGAGAMGVVYAAYDELLDRKVALKLLRPQIVADGGEDRLLREAQAMAQLSHPHIVSVFEVGHHGEQPFIAMEFVRGQSFDLWLAAEARPWQEVLPRLLAAGRGLAAAHQADIIHRDFKPHNVLIGVDGSVKVADFGLARSQAEPEAPVAAISSSRRMLDLKLTRQGVVVGTPAYMAPEQHAGEPCDARSDQFSYCVAAYQALYGALPFPTTSLEALLAAVGAGRVSPAPPGSPVPTWLRRVVLRGLAPDPEQRWPSMDTLLVALADDPAIARRRRFRAGLLGGGVGLLGLLGGIVATVYSPSTCPDGVAELRGAWDDERRQAVADALRATGLPFAETTRVNLEHGLDRYAEAWTAMRTDACEAHRAGRQSDTQYDLRMRCLDQRRTHLASMTEALVHVDAASLPRAALADSSLPPVATCGDLDALLNDPLRPPDDPATAPIVARVQAGLAQVRALEGTGLFARAVAAADEIAADAAAAVHPPFLAELALYRGRALLGDQPEAADAALTTAYREGLGGGHDRVAAEALARRIFVRGYYFSREDAVLHDEETLLALLARVDDDGRLRGEYLNNMGVVRLRLGDLPRAESLLVAALAAKTGAYGPDAGELVYTQTNLGTLQNDLGRTDAAIGTLQAALAVGTPAFGATHPTMLLVRDNLGIAYLKHKRLHDAEATLLAVRDDALARSEPDHVSLAFVERHLAWIALDRRRPDQAEDRLDAAEARLHAVGGQPMAAARIEVLRAYADALRGDREATLAHHQRARETLAATLPPTHPHWMILEGHLADLELQFERHDTVLALARTALAPLTAEDAGTLLARAGAHEHEAWALHGLGRHDEAIRAGTDALALLERVIAEENPRVADLLRHIAAAEAAAGRRDAALAHLDRALNIFVRESDPDLPALAAARFDRARLIADQSPAEARALAQTARDVYRDAGDGFAKELAEVEGWLAAQR